MLGIDLFCGLGGWADGLLAEGWDVIGFDTEQHIYGEHRYPGLLVVQDVLTLHGSQFCNADLIVASPPCQEYSYMAMPWKKAKAKAAAIRADRSGKALEKLNRLFNACFRIQREASQAAGRHIPLIVENVKGAQPWVGRSRWNFGSFHLWGDVPALMPSTRAPLKGGDRNIARAEGGHRWNVEFGIKVPGMNWRAPDDPRHRPGQGFNTLADRGLKNGGGSWFNIGSPGQKVLGNNPDGRKGEGRSWFGDYATQKAHGAISPGRLHHSGSSARKAASAMIAKIPAPLSRYIGATFASAPR